MQTWNKRRLINTLAIFIIAGVMVYMIGSGHLPRKQQNETKNIQGFAFDTTYQITIYQGGTKKTLQKCVSECSSYENVISRTKETSTVYRINALSKKYEELLPGKLCQSLQKGQTIMLSKQQRTEYETKLKQALPEAYTELACHVSSDGSISFQVNDTLQKLVNYSFKYGKLSKGCFTMGIEPVSSLWDFSTDQPTVPQDAEIRKAQTYVGDEHIRLHNDRLSFSVPGTGIEFGGIAKGYIADRLKDLLRQDGVTSALIDLGGNILCLGNKPDGTAFRIGVRQPFSDRDAVIDTVAVKDLSVVSSGIYERCFKQNGKFYHHILDPSTGYPVDNTLMAVTILSKASVDGDGLSTTCFGLGLEKGMELIDSLDNVEAVFVTKDEKMHYSKGYAKYHATQK